MLVLTTDRFQLAVLSFDARERRLVTLASGDLRDRIGRPCERGQLVVADPAHRALALQFCDGLLKLLPCERGFRGGEKAFNVRLEEQDVLDLCFLQRSATAGAAGAGAPPQPTLCLLFKDQADEMHLHTYTVSLADRALRPGPWGAPQAFGASGAARGGGGGGGGGGGANSCVAVPGDPKVLIPVPAPLGGVLVLGSQQVHYFSPQGRRGGDGGLCASLRLNAPLEPRCFCVIDATRFLVADADGGLFLLAVEPAAAVARDDALDESEDSAPAGGSGAGAGAGGVLAPFPDRKASCRERV